MKLVVCQLIAVELREESRKTGTAEWAKKNWNAIENFGCRKKKCFFDANAFEISYRIKSKHVRHNLKPCNYFNGRWNKSTQHFLCLLIRPLQNGVKKSSREEIIIFIAHLHIPQQVSIAEAIAASNRVKEEEKRNSMKQVRQSHRRSLRHHLQFAWKSHSRKMIKTTALNWMRWCDESIRNWR